MTNQELHQLATEYAGQNPPADIKDEVLKRNLIGLNAEIFEKFLVWLTKSHCIVSREMIMAEYADAKATRDLYMSATCINTMESRAIDHSNGRMCELNKLFGKSTFENNKTIDNEDNKDV